MSEQTLDHLLATAVGGLIGAGVGFLGMYLQRRWNRQDRRGERLTNAYADWARSFERTISHHCNYYRLLMMGKRASPDAGLKGKYDDEVIRVSARAGDAGRELDANHYVLLMLEDREWAKRELSELTEATMMSDVKETDPQVAEQYLKGASELRDRLRGFLKRLCASSHLG